MARVLSLEVSNLEQQLQYPGQTHSHRFGKYFLFPRTNALHFCLPKIPESQNGSGWKRPQGVNQVEPLCSRNVVMGISAPLVPGTSFPGVLYHLKPFPSLCWKGWRVHSRVGPFPAWERRKSKAEDARIEKSSPKVCQGLNPSAWLAVPPSPCQKSRRE